jgi:hypothetical protein
MSLKKNYKKLYLKYKNKYLILKGGSGQICGEEAGEPYNHEPDIYTIVQYGTGTSSMQYQMTYCQTCDKLIYKNIIDSIWSDNSNGNPYPLTQNTRHPILNELLKVQKQEQALK